MLYYGLAYKSLESYRILVEMSNVIYSTRCYLPLDISNFFSLYLILAFKEEVLDENLLILTCILQ